MSANELRPELLSSRSRRSLPYYLRIRDHFAAQIDQGALKPHTQLPSERTLSETLKISRMTARQALVQLEAEGLAYRVIRRGWFVAPPRLHYNLSRSVSFRENVVALGETPGTRLLSSEKQTATKPIRDRLRMAPGEHVYSLRRLRLFGPRPAMIETLHLPAYKYPGLLELDLESGLDETLEHHYGLRPRRGHISLRLGTLTATDAETLETPEGRPGLFVTRTILDHEGEPIECDEETWRGDIALFYADISIN